MWQSSMHGRDENLEVKGYMKMDLRQYEPVAASFEHHSQLLATLLGEFLAVSIH
jgi:hypothetical protein